MVEATLDVYTVQPVSHRCKECGNDVPSEPNETIHNGKSLTIYSPASRYWFSVGNPNKMLFAFCSADCATKFGHGKK